MPTDGSPDTPMAVIVEESTEVAPVTLAPEPKRRRVRRKVATGDTAAEAIPDVTPDEAEPVAEPAVLDVTPEEAAAALEALPEPMVAAVAEPKPAPQPEVDVAALIAEDPNQIVAPPEKPKRGWWRR
jgi:ribonuclease E